MWADALRIVKEYIPSKLDEFQKEMAAKSGKYVSQLSVTCFPNKILCVSQLSITCLLARLKLILVGTMRNCYHKALCGNGMESIHML